MSSSPYWNDSVKKWINRYYPSESKILDIGAGKGKYSKLLGDYKYMDAIETWEPHLEELKALYANVFHINALDFAYSKTSYDLVILGDVLEHFTVEHAQKLLREILLYAKEVLVIVPYELPQDIDDGVNPLEKHLQPDLTPTNMKERYPCLYPLICFYDPNKDFKGMGVYTSIERPEERVDYSSSYATKGVCHIVFNGC
jgi:SAM-dependent methyltransferase